MWTDVEQLIPLCQALSWVLRPREALNLTDCMWLAPLHRMYFPWLGQLWICSMDTRSYLFLNPAERWLLMMLQANDFSSQLSVTGKKILPLFHLVVPCSFVWKLKYSPRNIQTFTYFFFSAKHKLCGSQTFKELSLCMRILLGISLFPSLHSQTSLFWDMASPVCIFASEVPAWALWDWSIHHHINMLQTCPYSPCFFLLWEVTQQCSGTLYLSLSPLSLCGFFSGLCFTSHTWC